MTTATLSTIEAARLANVSVRQLGYWAETGYVHPTRQPGSGRGRGSSVLRWTAADVDRAELLGLLSRQLRRADLWERLAVAIEHGTYIVLPDGEHEVVVSWRRRQYTPPVGSGLD